MPRRRGFTLLELAVIMAVMGAVVGGVYMAAGAVYEKNKRSKAETQVITLVQNLRKAYSGKSQIPTLLSAAAKQAGILPSDMIVTSGWPNGVYGAVYIINATFGSAAAVNIYLWNVPAAFCIDLLTNIFGNRRQWNSMGVAEIAIPGGPWDWTSPMSLSAATDGCTTNPAKALYLTFYKAL